MIGDLEGLMSNLNTLSKKKLKKQLEAITGKLKNVVSENHSEDEEYQNEEMI